MKSIKELAAEVKRAKRSRINGAMGVQVTESWYDAQLVKPLLDAIEGAEEWSVLRPSSRPGTVLFFPNPQPSLIEAAKVALNYLEIMPSSPGRVDILCDNLRVAIEIEEAKDA